MGHAYMILLVMLCQTLVYREVTTLFSLKSATPESDEIQSNGKDPWSKTLNWYFFAVTNYFLYGESIIYYFKVSSIRCLIHITSAPSNKGALVSIPARGLCGCTATSICNKPSYHQLHPVYYRLCRLRHVFEERILEAAVRSLLLGAHEFIAHRSLKV